MDIIEKHFLYLLNAYKVFIKQLVYIIIVLPIVLKYKHKSYINVLTLLSCQHEINGLMQERRNSCALAMELRLSCTNPLIWTIGYVQNKQKKLFININKS